jgi:hypothetical protein
MFDNIENPILEHLHHIRSRVELIVDDMSDLKLHISSLESAMVSVKHEVAHGDETDARQQVTLDKLAERVHRIERRLELLD